MKMVLLFYKRIISKLIFLVIMKKIILLSLITVLFSGKGNAQTSIYDYTVKNINNEDFHFADLKGKRILIVNTASECGLTPQYGRFCNCWFSFK